MPTDLAQFVLGAVLNLLVAVVIVRFIYYPATHEKAYVFTFLAFNTVIYFVLALLNTAELGVGVGFGLFAIFSVLRYRTDPIPIREMTYLFIIIALPVVNSLLVADGDWVRLAITDGTVAALLVALERGWGFRYEGSARILYERVALVTPERREELLADLRARTGLPITRVEIGRLDYLRDAVELRAFYELPRGNGASQALDAPAATALADDED